MDVGLNNRNTLGKFAPELEDVVFFVKATSCEQFTLWQEWSKESMHNITPLSDDIMRDILVHKFLSAKIKYNVEDLNNQIKKIAQERVNWKQIHLGFCLTIGHIQKKPVVVSFSFASIGGKKICFYNCCSQMVDHEMVDNWLMTHFQLTHENYTRRNHVDAMNFHNCINSLDKIDKEPRDTVYKSKQIIPAKKTTIKSNLKVKFPTVEEMNCPSCKRVTEHSIKNDKWTCVHCNTPL